MTGAAHRSEAAEPVKRGRPRKAEAESPRKRGRPWESPKPEND